MKRLILAGGGHGHVMVVSQLEQIPTDDLEIILISQSQRQYYSGMLPAFIEDIYDAQAISFDLQALCQQKGIDFVQDTITEINDQDQMVHTERASYSYDLLSMNLGSTAIDFFELDPNHSTYVKPIMKAVNFKKKLDQEVKTGQKNYKMLIVGGGAAGVELALAFDSQYGSLEIDLITASPCLLPIFNKRCRQMVEADFKKKGIGLYLDERVLAVEGKQVRTDKNLRAFDYLVMCTGIQGSKISYKGFNLAANNYVQVDDKLMANDHTLAMGDMVELSKYPDLPKAGVYAIRQAPILFNNLKVMLEKRPASQLAAYRPQKTYLQILNSGGKRAIANYGPLAFQGKWAWKLKDKIDRTYMKSHS